MDIFIIFAAGFIAGGLVVRWLLQQLLLRFILMQDKQLLEETSNRIELEVEIDDKVILCYNKTTKEFVCQGANLVEIEKHFVSRFPNSIGFIVGGKEDAIDAIKQQI